MKPGEQYFPEVLFIMPVSAVQGSSNVFSMWPKKSYTVTIQTPRLSFFPCYEEKG